MRLNPYLSFNGNCAAAFRFYEKVFGGANRIASNPSAEGESGDVALDHAAMEAGTD